MVHVMAAFPSLPVRIVLPQFQIQAVQAAGCTDVEGVLSDLAYRGDSRQSKKEAVYRITEPRGSAIWEACKDRQDITLKEFRAF